MKGDKECMKGNHTYLNHTHCSAPSCCCRCYVLMAAHVYVRAGMYALTAPLCETLCERVCVECFFFFFVALVCVCDGGCEAVQSPGRTEWIYKLMEFKASSIDYHYNKQQHTECLIIFRQRFCALSSNSADAVTLSDICL